MSSRWQPFPSHSFRRAVPLAIAFGFVALASVPPDARGSDPAERGFRDVVSETAISADAHAAAHAVIATLGRTPARTDGFAALSASLSDTPRVVGDALDAERHSRRTDGGSSLRAHAGELRRLVRALGPPAQRLQEMPAYAVVAERVEELASALDEASTGSGAGDRQERLEAILTRLREGDWRSDPGRMPALQPTHLFYTGEDVGEAAGSADGRP